MTELLIICTAIGLGIYIQSIAGFGAGLIAMPILLTLLPFSDAITLLSIFLALFSLTQTHLNWKYLDKKLLIKIGLALIVGLQIGIHLIITTPPDTLKKVLGIFILTYATYTQLKKHKVKLPPHSEIPLGLIGGISSGLFASGGPFYVISIQNKLAKKNAIRATIISVLAITNISRLPLLYVNKMFSTELLTQSLYILPTFIIALLLGNITYKKINQESFKKIVTTLLVVSGGVLVFN